MQGEKKDPFEQSVPPVTGPRLIVLAGPRLGEVLALGLGESRVGTDPGADLNLYSPTMSCHHFTIRCDGQQTWIRKREGEVSVNNRRVDEAPLRERDYVCAGGILLQYLEAEVSDLFYVGSQLFGRDAPSRQFRRFSMIASADAVVGKEQKRLSIISVKDVGRGGLALFSKEEVSEGSVLRVSLYSRSPERIIVAESIGGRVVSVIPWKGSLYLLNIRFLEPISLAHQPNLHRQLIELENYL